ncbi:hypothetical protein HK102_006178 [Quaeritorhiza haematococci]|nr:hypothetical protein HK102_006178 [Quaeritorhiza haematococci]
MTTTTNPLRAPAAFVPHGGGPLPLLNDPSSAGLTKFLSKFGPSLNLPDGSKPKAILLVTAHWEANVPSISNNSTHSLLFDYYGFPPESYKFTYPAPGHPEIAAKAARLVESRFGGKVKLDAARGWDHGVFVPLKLIVPDASIPVVQMSVLSSLDPADHIRLGQALAPLRDEGVAIVGSGMSFHNMRFFRMGGFTQNASKLAKYDGSDFNDAIVDACTKVTGEEREKRLADWEKMPGARLCHEREEHLMPLLVVAGASGEDVGKLAFDGDMLGFKISGFLFK